MNFLNTLLCLPMFLCFTGMQAQTDKRAAPSLKSDPAEEDYSYLKDEESANEYETIFAQDLKFISLNQSKTSYLSLGGHYRPRFESTTNENNSEEDLSYYSQRLNLHGDLHLGNHIRIFTDLIHGLTSSNEPQALEDEDFAIHQAYLEFSIPTQENELAFTFGRKELDYGAARLIARRNGPNMRRSFDLGMADYEFRGNKIDLFYGKEVLSQFGALDNEFTLLEQDVPNPSIWGVYSDIEVHKVIGNTQLYYLGFHSNASSFSDLSGK